VWSKQRWSVRVGCLPLGHTETANCSLGPVALSSCSVQIQLKLSVLLWKYHHNNNKCYVSDRGPVSVVRIGTGYQLNVLEIVSQQRASCNLCVQDGPGALPNLLYTGYRFFPRVKDRLGRVTAPSPTSSAMV